MSTVVAATVIADTAGATTINVGGGFTFAADSPLACPLAVVCATGTFTGNIQGPFTNTITSLVPAPVVGVGFFSGNIVVHTSRGDLRCGLAGALDTLSSDGEFGEICVITGGTHDYYKASGHLRLTGTSPQTQTPVIGTTGSGEYQGKVVAPFAPSD
ncbi:MAG: hypothetical protein ACRD1K_13045 [Acidimicrobiales bacterium]